MSEGKPRAGARRWFTWGVETVLVFILSACLTVWLLDSDAKHTREYQDAVAAFAPTELLTTYVDALTAALDIRQTKESKTLGCDKQFDDKFEEVSCLDRARAQRDQNLTIFRRWILRHSAKCRDEAAVPPDVEAARRLFGLGAAGECDPRGFGWWQQIPMALIDTAVYVFYAQTGWALFATYMQLIGSLIAGVSLLALTELKWGPRSGIERFFIVVIGASTASLLLGFIGKLFFIGIVAIHLTIVERVFEFINHRASEWIVPKLMRTLLPRFAD
jgi:hypothetical protein